MWEKGGEWREEGEGADVDFRMSGTERADRTGAPSCRPVAGIPAVIQSNAAGTRSVVAAVWWAGRKENLHPFRPESNRTGTRPDGDRSRIRVRLPAAGFAHGESSGRAGSGRTPENFPKQVANTFGASGLRPPPPPLPAFQKRPFCTCGRAAEDGCAEAKKKKAGSALVFQTAPGHHDDGVVSAYVVHCPVL